MEPRHALGATLITGHDRPAMRVLGAMLLGKTPGAIIGPDEVSGDHPDSSADLALALADQLSSWADDGKRGSVIVELDSRVDSSEFGLVLTRVLADRDPAAPRVAVHDLLAVVSVADIRRLLFRDGAPLDADTDDSSETLAQQIEFATAVVLVDFESSGAAPANESLELVRRLAPRAGLYSLSAAGRLVRHGPTTRARVDELGSSAGWMLELSGRGVRPGATAGLTTMVFRDPRPFHPGRLADTIARGLDPDSGAGLVLRSRGLIRLATRADQVGSWASAGAMLALNPTGIPSWTEDAPLGQEIVIVGRELDPSAVTERLAACLLDAEELIAGPARWSAWADPFPAWETAHEH
jgi:G3E family GTPase